MKRKQYDIIIVGAGLIGAALALRLAYRTNFRIAVVERAAPIASNGIANQRVIALGNIAQKLLEEVEVFPNKNNLAAYPYQKMLIWDESSDGELSFNAADYQQAHLGYMVDSEKLVFALQQAMEKQSAIEVFYDFNASRLDLKKDQASLCSADLNLSGQLVVAADGARSWVRSQAKIFAQSQGYDQKGIVARIYTSESHQDSAWQIFLKTGPLGVLPLANNQSSIVWSANNEFADELLALSDEAFNLAITDALQARLGDVALLSKRQSFPLASLKSDQYFKRHLVLIGDAAHSIHPLAGQGANLGFKDVVALVDVLTDLDNKSLGELGILERYQLLRRADNKQTDAVMTALNRAYQGDAPWWTILRGMGMNWVSDSAALKGMLARQAMGIK